MYLRSMLLQHVFCLCFLGGCTAMEPFIASREPMEAVLFAWRLQLESR